MHRIRVAWAAIAEKGSEQWKTIPLRTRRNLLWTVVALAALVLLAAIIRRSAGSWRSNAPWSTGSSTATGASTSRKAASPPKPIDPRFEVWDADTNQVLILPSAFGAGERDLAGLNQTADDHELRLGLIETSIAEKLSRERDHG